MASGDSDGAAKSESSMSMPMWLTVKSLKAKFPQVRNLSTDLLYQWLNCPTGGGEAGSEQQVILLDARDKVEYDVSHLPGAILTEPGKSNITELVQFINEQCNKKPCKAIVCYCSLGYRSSSLAEKLKTAMDSEAKGTVFSELPIYNLEGSIFKWANERKPMINSHNKPTVYAHPYNSVFGKLLEHSLRKSSFDSCYEESEVRKVNKS
ncbi:uncharacterized protein LOC106179969 [Lingula anatina]|uniref:Uncharacterized protein LOC106179969 n=1 Tax=Lingula anatina TaxID=7574 RepID=A0A1S3KAG2_LINAN|nr:uncharacterized protein LOC106179969 [Lingula anatina]|eukprot:XP_013419251.1 uncharacterized protein LOC106179969 [Lingula anatina]